MLGLPSLTLAGLVTIRCMQEERSTRTLKSFRIFDWSLTASSDRMELQGLTQKGLLHLPEKLWKRSQCRPDPWMECLVSTHLDSSRVDPRNWSIHLTVWGGSPQWVAEDLATKMSHKHGDWVPQVVIHEWCFFQSVQTLLGYRKAYSQCFGCKAGINQVPAIYGIN